MLDHFKQKGIAYSLLILMFIHLEGMGWGGGWLGELKSTNYACTAEIYKLAKTVSQVLILWSWEYTWEFW